jgi:twitching motility protein PilU
MDRDKAIKFIHDLLRMLKSKGGSDLFITSGAAPSMKIDGQVKAVAKQVLTADHTQELVRSIMNDRQLAEFEQTNECNFAVSLQGVSRFRVNAFVQRGSIGMVIRILTSEIPTFEDLKLPLTLRDISMAKRGLVVFVGATGSGKSTSQAAFIDYRNINSAGHIISIEDPIEYVHRHKSCLVTQREIGTDTADWEIALKNTLRQAPDVILIGEVRDRETMEHAIVFAETGHLCICTLHANNTNQAMDRIVNFFPEDRREQLLMDLSLNLKAVISQRLVRMTDGVGRRAAVEILINTPLMADLILKGDVPAMKELMAKSREQGMQTFDQSLFDLIEEGAISMDEGLRHADSVNDLRLRLKLEGSEAKKSNLLDEVKDLKIQTSIDR